MSNNIKGFSKYLVIFIDILGSQNRNDYQETYKINDIFHEELQNNTSYDMEHTVYFRKVYSFSDCAYIFYGFKDGIEDTRKDLGKLFTVALCNCEPIFLRFIKERILFRGGISYGEAYIDLNRSMFFGPAVNKAYKLESETAIHPRIIIDSVVAEETINNIEQVKYRTLANDTAYLPYLLAYIVPPMPFTGDGIVKKDIDGQYIYNYLHFPENNIILSQYYSSAEDFINELIEFCKKQIENIQSYKIQDKYFYLKRFSEKILSNLLSDANLV
ncbi:MAG: hypothetical protein J6K17_06910 [Oscillospiraceae bacterium]|nr:hypothetical protein [Oscillospiraceae bacterium]